jgi:hypothetical protein
MTSQLLTLVSPLFTEDVMAADIGNPTQPNPPVHRRRHRYDDGYLSSDIVHQLHHFTRACAVIAPHGAGLTMMLGMQAGTRARFSKVVLQLLVLLDLMIVGLDASIRAIQQHVSRVSAVLSVDTVNHVATLKAIVDLITLL